MLNNCSHSTSEGESIAFADASPVDVSPAAVGDAAAYALNALDVDERDAFEEYLQFSEVARAEVDTFRAVAASLASLVAPVTPSADLGLQIMAQLPGVPQLSMGADRVVTGRDDAAVLESDLAIVTGPVFRHAAPETPPTLSDDVGADESSSERRVGWLEAAGNAIRVPNPS